MSIHDFFEFATSFSKENLYLLIAVAAQCIIAILITTRIKKTPRYNEESKHIVLDSLRSYFEDKIYTANEKMLSDTHRWLLLNNTVLQGVNCSSDNCINPNDNSLFDDNLFFKEIGIDISSIKVDPNKVFFLSPFHEKFLRVFRKVRTICKQQQLECIRGDEHFITSSILRYILTEMLSSSIVIANIDGRNPNVFYELGIAHATNKMVIIIAAIDKLGTLPFDIKSQRIVLWDNFQDLEVRLSLALRFAKSRIKRSSESLKAINLT